MHRSSFLLRFSFILGMQGVLFTSCIFPLRSFDKSKAPKPPDYSKTETWAALPTKKDNADLFIDRADIIDNQENAEVDVFFIHPTTYRIGFKWNAKLNKKRINKRTDRLTLTYQASVFNASCKVYVPRYRQASLVTYIEKKGNAPKVFNLAYQDVRQAFIYYLKNYNQGRPFVIASHSQGTDHAIRLVNEFIKKDSVLYKQFVTAYLLGRPVDKQTIKTIPQCKKADDCGCFNTWNAVPWGEKLLFRQDPGKLICNNPLNWRTDTTYAPASLNKGSLPLTCKDIDTCIADAKIVESGILWVHRPLNKTSKDYLYIRSESFHVLEYSLFYMNIRENVKQRVQTYLTNSKK